MITCLQAQNQEKMSLPAIFERWKRSTFVSSVDLQMLATVLSVIMPLFSPSTSSSTSPSALPEEPSSSEHENLLEPLCDFKETIGTHDVAKPTAEFPATLDYTSISSKELKYRGAHSLRGNVLPRGSTYVVYNNELYVLVLAPDDREELTKLQEKAHAVLSSPFSDFTLERTTKEGRILYQKGVYYLRSINTRTRRRIKQR